MAILPPAWLRYWTDREAQLLARIADLEDKPFDIRARARRDWAMGAFRDNMPYDRFVIEQLAGDLLPDATVDQKVASGFNRNHVITDEGGAISEEYLVEYAVDRVNTTSSVFLGSRRIAERYKPNASLRAWDAWITWHFQLPPQTGPGLLVALLGALGFLAWRSGTAVANPGMSS